MTEPHDPSTDRLVEIASHLLAIDTQNPPGDTRVFADWIERFFTDLSISTDRFATDPVKPNLVARLPGKSDRTILYNGHMDTVQYNESAWTYDPLGERVDDRLYGRGATDMKGPLAAMLYVAERFATADEPPPTNVVFAVVSDEETGGNAGVSALIDKGVFAERQPDACVIGETTCSGGHHSVTVADRGSIWLTLEAEGTAAHGSRPLDGDNAIDHLWDAVSMIRERLGERELPLSEELQAIVDESVEYYEPTLGRAAARTLFEHPTVNLGTIEGGEAVNTVPSAATAQLDIRLTAGVDTAAILTDIRACLDDHPAVGIGDVQWSVGTAEPIDSPVVKAVSETAERVANSRIYRRSATGGGDTKTFRNAGIPTVEFAFGTDTVHAVDEYTTLQALEWNATVYETLPAAIVENMW